MADEELINTSIDEYLISLANSVNHAQRYISQLRVAGQDGQPSITYQLPRVDFELKLLFQVARNAPPAGAPQRNIARAEGGAFLEARPISLDENASTAEAASTIKGSFVAVPVSGGTPPPVVSVSWEPETETKGKYKLTVTVHSRIGEILPGIEVQFNLDKDLAKALNSAYGGESDMAKILPNTKLKDGIQLTDGKGEAKNELTIGDPDRKVPVVIDVLGISRTLIFESRAQ